MVALLASVVVVSPASTNPLRKVRQWKEEGRVEREAEEKRGRGTRRADDAMEVDDGDIPDDESDESQDEEDNTAEVKALKVWRLLCPC